MRVKTCSQKVKKESADDVLNFASKVATGLYTQSKDAKIKTSKQGEIVIDDIQEGKIPIKMFVKVSPEMKVEDFKTIEHKQGRKEILVLVKPSKTGEVKHIFGYELK